MRGRSITFFWGKTLHHSVIGSRRFEATCFFHFQGINCLKILDVPIREGGDITLPRNVGIRLRSDVSRWTLLFEPCLT